MARGEGPSGVSLDESLNTLLRRPARRSCPAHRRRWRGRPGRGTGRVGRGGGCVAHDLLSAAVRRTGRGGIGWRGCRSRWTSTTPDVEAGHGAVDAAFERHGAGASADEEAAGRRWSPAETLDRRAERPARACCSRRPATARRRARKARRRATAASSIGFDTTIDRQSGRDGSGRSTKGSRAMIFGAAFAGERGPPRAGASGRARRGRCRDRRRSAPPRRSPRQRWDGARRAR